MKTIGIDTKNSMLVYEGSSLWGYPIWPTPTLIALSVADETSELLSPEDDQHDTQRLRYLFLDEGYDPTSRVRKGRIFIKYNDSQPHEWHVRPHPLEPSEIPFAASSNGVIKKYLSTYAEFNLHVHLRQLSISRPLFILGNSNGFTIWSLVDAEAIVSGETLVYLKARKVFGALPQLNISAIPEIYHSQLTDKLNILVEDLHRAGPESIIDRCRDAAAAILSAYLQQAHDVESGKDLGALITLYEREYPQNQIIGCQARTIARLHSRGKNAEQEKRNIRPPTEADAELTVQAIGIIMRDLGWGL